MTSSRFNDFFLKFEFGSLNNPWFICKCNEIISLFSQNVKKVAISEKWVSLPNSISLLSLPTVFSKPPFAGFRISKYLEQYKVQRKFISRMVWFLCYLPLFQEWTSNSLSFDLRFSPIPASRHFYCQLAFLVWPVWYGTIANLWFTWVSLWPNTIKNEKYMQACLHVYICNYLLFHRSRVRWGRFRGHGVLISIYGVFSRFPLFWGGLLLPLPHRVRCHGTIDTCIYNKDINAQISLKPSVLLPGCPAVMGKSGQLQTRQNSGKYINYLRHLNVDKW